MLTNGSKRIFTAALFVLVEDDKVGHIEHLNLLKLSVSAEFSGHHVQGTVGHRGDGVAALTNTACFAEDHIESNRLGHFDGSVEVGADFRTRATAGKTAHVEVIVGE